MLRLTPFLAVLALSLGWASPSPAQQFPKFEVVPCCQLCPEAAEPLRYEDSGFLSSFKMLIQGKDGWLFRSEDDLRMDFGPDPEGMKRLKGFRDALAARGTELVIVLQPPRGLMHAEALPRDAPVPYDADIAHAHYVRALREMRAQGIAVPMLEQLADQGGQGGYFFRGDHHWTPEGARRTAQIVAAQIRELPQYEALARKRFVTARNGLLAKRGTMQKAAKMLCGYGSPDQYVARYVTEPAGEAGADLFGDTSTPQVTLVGTSNSDAAYNFGGFLSEYLEADVLNAAMAGGGFDGALLSYLPSKEFQETPPRILVWELETYHNLSDPDFYRQVMPLIDNGCSGAPVALQRELGLRMGRNEVLFNGGGAVRELRGRDHVLDLQFSDPSVSELRAVVWYTNGAKEHIHIEGAERIDRAGRFVLDLRNDGNWGDQVFLSLDVELQPPPPPEAGAAPKSAAPPRLRAQLCGHANSRRPVTVTAGLAGAVP